jgi:acetaldehyde dehydrogenase
VKVKTSVAILGPGNIGTDLMLKVERSASLQVALVAGIIPDSPGLLRARELGLDASDRGLDAVLERDDVEIVFDATSARAHLEHAPVLREAGKKVIDLTPSAVGPYVVPGVNLEEHLTEPNLNLISCGGQATIPIVHAINRACGADYAEVVATIASASAGQGTRQNIDEFTATTARGVETVGGARRGKAIIILNPAQPPILMRNTVYATVRDADRTALDESVRAMVSELRQYVPGYRLLLVDLDEDRATVIAEVEGSGDFLPRYAGNLDIMTAAAVRVGEVVAGRAPAFSAP